MSRAGMQSHLQERATVAWRLRAAGPALVALATFAFGSPARAAPGSPELPVATAVSPQEEQAPPAGSTLRVFLMTIGQGDAIWEKFGHNALWLRDERSGLNVAYNYGMFSFDQPGYIGRFLKGNMQYWMEGFDGDRLASYYAESNRSVWVQELDLSAAEKEELRTFLEWNAREENKYYRYDYYRDNCSTRVRDAIDRVIGGALRESIEPQPTGTTYRWHTSRLTAGEVPAYTGLMLGLGPYVDRPINEWEESFLPVRLMEHMRTVTVARADGSMRPLVQSELQLFAAERPAEREAPPARTIPFAIAGLIAGSLLFLAGRMATSGRVAAAGFFALALIWSVGAGIVGSIMIAIWTLTDHTAGYDNANILQVNTLSLILAGMLVFAAAGRARRATLRLATVITALAGVGLLLHLTPWGYQVNGPIIGLAFPIHTGIAAGFAAWSRTGSQASPG